ncbi:MAG: hypothetical protein OEW33_08375 [Nitrospirota bacterium]|nr:hypothetical protein [Nitrospirota bacterium]
MKRFPLVGLSVLFVCGLAFSTSGCGEQKEGPAEQAGTAVDQAIEKTTDSVKETMEHTGAAINEASEKTGEAVKEAVDSTEKMVEDATHK